MKMALKTSVLLNLVLLGWLSWPLVKGLQPAAVPPQPVATNETRKVDEAMAAPPIAPKPTPTQPCQFRWDQLYDRNYHVYVKNLRSIGCPEPTVRAIVTADVEVVIQQQADELVNKISDFASSSWSSKLAHWTNEIAWKAELMRLPDEEAAMVADCLGESMAASSATVAQDQPQKAAKVNESYPMVDPLIEQPVDIAALNLNEWQLQSIKDLQQDFLQKMGGTNQDSNDPAYRARWRAAQEEADNLLKGMLGDQAYEDYQAQALIQAQSGSNGQAQSSDP